MDLSTPLGMLASMHNLSYFLLFLVFIVEGPITSYVAGFAASLGFFNVFIILILGIMGNVVGDLLYYFIGKFGGRNAFIKRLLKRSLKCSHMKLVKRYLYRKPGRALIVIKIVPFFPTAGLIFTGAINLPLGTFLFYSFVISAAYSSLVTFLGFYSGVFFSRIFNYVKFWPFMITTAAILAVACWLLIRFIIKKISQRLKIQ